MLCSTTTKKAAGREKEGHKALDNIHTQRAEKGFHVPEFFEQKVM